MSNVTIEKTTLKFVVRAVTPEGKEIFKHSTNFIGDAMESWFKCKKDYANNPTALTLHSSGILLLSINLPEWKG